MKTEPIAEPSDAFRFVTACRGVAVCIATLLLIGCGRSGRELADVRGTVTLDGQPLTGAQLDFQPENSGGSPSFGLTDSSGHYELMYKRDVKGAQIGWHKIEIKPASKNKPLPRIYNADTTLRREVKAGDANQVDFALSSKPE